jgi:hypothetical protein
MTPDQLKNRPPDPSGASSEAAGAPHAVLAPVPADLAAERDRLVAAARACAEASLAESTRDAYQDDLEDFALWCHDHRVASLPATPRPSASTSPT